MFLDVPNTLGYGYFSICDTVHIKFIYFNGLLIKNIIFINTFSRYPFVYKKQ